MSKARDNVEKLRPAINAAEFGVVGNGTTDDRSALQAAIDHAVGNGFRELRINPGDYLIDGTLVIKPPSAGFVSLAIVGAQGAFLGRTRFIHAAGQKLNPLLAIQSTRDVVIKSIRFSGNNVAPSTSAVGTDQWRNPDPTAYVTSGCSTGRYNPYAGIAIDSLHGTAPTNLADRYTFGSYGQGLSSKIKIEDCRIEGFIVGAICNAATGSENYVFDRVQFVENKFAIATTGSQQRNIIADNCDFNGHWVIFDNVTFNAQNGPPITVLNGILAQAYRIFQAKMDAGLLTMTGGYCESVSSIGLISPAGSSAAVCAQFAGVTFSFLGYEQNATEIAKDLPIVNFSSGVSFTGCDFATQFLQPVVGNGPFVFESCTFRAEGDGITTAEKQAFAIVTPYNNEGQIIVNNCVQRQYSGTTQFLNNTQYVSTIPARALLARNVSEVVNSVTAKRYIVQTPSAGYARTLTGVSNVTYVGTDTLTFDFTVDASRPLFVGDTLYWQTLVPALEGATPITRIMPAVRVTNIASTTATCKRLAVLDTTFAPTSLDIVVPRFINATISKGDTTSGSADITNVTNISNFAVGDWLSFSNSSFHQFVRVSSIVSTTITCHRTLNVTATGVEIYNAKLLDVSSLAQKVLSGAGSPETVVSADVGALYLRTDGGASTTLYVKESGTGNTGWVAK
jgi:hypothetical protein